MVPEGVLLNQIDMRQQDQNMQILPSKVYYWQKIQLAISIGTAHLAHQAICFMHVKT